MSGNKIALDSNQAIAVLNQAVEAEGIRPYGEVFLPVPVVGELHFGALNSRHVDANLERITQLVSRCVVLNIDEQTASIYASIRRDLKQKGRPIPENDVWIAALCKQYDLPLATADRHFLEIPAIQVIHF